MTAPAEILLALESALRAAEVPMPTLHFSSQDDAEKFAALMRVDGPAPTGEPVGSFIITWPAPTGPRTRDGREVEDLGYVPGDRYPWEGKVCGETHCWTVDGYYYNQHTPCGIDIVTPLPEIK